MTEHTDWSVTFLEQLAHQPTWGFDGPVSFQRGYLDVFITLSDTFHKPAVALHRRG